MAFALGVVFTVVVVTAAFAFGVVAARVVLTPPPAFGVDVDAIVNVEVVGPAVVVAL